MTALALPLLAGLAMPLAATAAALSPPSAVTGGGADLTASSATLTGLVDPHGGEASYRFQFGPTTAYGSETATVPVAAGTGNRLVTAPVGSLAPATTYHFRILTARPGGPDVAGTDKTFRTAAAPAQPRPPGAYKPGLLAVTPVSATLAISVNPQGAATTVMAQFGRELRFNRRAGWLTVPAGWKSVRVAVAIGQLSPNKFYRWRIVVSNSAGTSTSSQASFRTPAAPAAVALRPSTRRSLFGIPLALGGVVSGRGLAGMEVALEADPFPFGRYHAVARTRADSHGTFRFAARRARATTRYRVVVAGSPVLVSRPVRVTSLVRVRVRARRAGSRVRLTATVTPRLAAGRATLQVRTAAHKWRRAGALRLRPDGPRRSHAQVDVARRPAPVRMRVVVAPRDGGAHATGASASVVVR